MDADQKRSFLVELTKRANVSAACRAAGVSRVLAYRDKGRDPEFAKQWESALEVAVDDLESEVWRRAKEGVQRGIYWRGNLVGVERTYSDNLAIRLLEAHRPERYARDRNLKVTHEGDPDKPIVHTYVIDEPDLPLVIDILAEAGVLGLGDGSASPEDPEGTPH